jgi:uncharacterized protein (TIGR03066 family)
MVVSHPVLFTPTQESIMRALGLVRVAGLVLGLATVAYGDKDAAKDARMDGDKKAAIDKDKLIGVWESKDGEVIEFTKDGKIKVTVKLGDKEIKVEATYKVDGDKLTVEFKQGDKVEKKTATIKSLTDKSLVTVDEGGKAEELKRKK